MSGTKAIAEERVREKAYALWQAAGEPHGLADEFWLQAEAAVCAEEAAYDEALDESFPASDPPAHSGATE